jgi:hypothetical protein
MPDEDSRDNRSPSSANGSAGPPKPVHPAVRALDDPTSSAKPLIFADVLRFLPACPDMRSEAKLLDPLAYLLIIVALVET